jgi:hypothetical protein
MAHNPPSVTVRTYAKLNQYAASFKAGNITLGKFKELVFDAFDESGAFTSPAASMYNFMTGGGEGPNKSGPITEEQWRSLPNDYKVGSQPPAVAVVEPAPSPFGSTPSAPSPFEQPATAASVRDAETQRIIDEMLRNDAARIKALQAPNIFGAGPSVASPFGAGPSVASPFGAGPNVASPFRSAPQTIQPLNPADVAILLSQPTGVWGNTPVGTSWAWPSVASPFGAGPSVASPFQ